MVSANAKRETAQAVFDRVMTGRGYELKHWMPGHAFHPLDNRIHFRMHPAGKQLRVILFGRDVNRTDVQDLMLHALQTRRDLVTLLRSHGFKVTEEAA